MRKKKLEKIVEDTLQEYPWHTDYQLVHAKENFKFERTKSPTPTCWTLDKYSDDSYLPETIGFALSLPEPGVIKESQFISVIRYGEMIGKIISARYSSLVALCVEAHLEIPAYDAREDQGRNAEPGDIVERRSQPGRYFYFNLHHTNCGNNDQRLCHLTSIEKIGRASDCITTPWVEKEFIPVDHLPQLTTEESINLVHGRNIGPREALIAKWRPQK